MRPRVPPEKGNTVLVDCETCAVRDLQCGDCVMTVLLGMPGVAPGGVHGVYDVNPGERAALAALADGGLVPHLRMVPLGVPEGSPGGLPESVPEAS